MTVVVRPVAPGEHAEAGEVVVDAYRSLGDGPSVGYEAKLRDVAARAESSAVLVAVLEGRVVGCVTFVDAGGELSEVDDPDAASIRMLGVAPAAQGRGVGELLVRACIDRARAAGRHRLRLATQESMTAAHRLYERLGFRRDPESDFSPVPGVRLMSFVLEL